MDVQTACRFVAFDDDCYAAKNSCVDFFNLSGFDRCKFGDLPFCPFECFVCALWRRKIPFEVFIDLSLTISQVVSVVIYKPFIDRLRIKFPRQPDVEISGVRANADFQIRRHGVHVIL